MARLSLCELWWRDWDLSGAARRPERRESHGRVPTVQVCRSARARRFEVQSVPTGLRRSALFVTRRFLTLNAAHRTNPIHSALFQQQLEGAAVQLRPASRTRAVRGHPLLPYASVRIDFQFALEAALHPLRFVEQLGFVQRFDSAQRTLGELLDPLNHYQFAAP